MLLGGLFFFAKDLGGEEEDLCVRFFPGVGFEAGFSGAAVAEEFFFGPTGFAGDLGQEASATVAPANVDAVLAQFEGEGLVGFLQRGDNGDFDVDLAQFLGADAVEGETGVGGGGLGHLFDASEQGGVSDESTDAATESAVVFYGDEASAVFGEEGVGGFVSGRLLAED